MEIELDHRTLHVTSDGDPSGSPVLLLHGITSCTATWEWLVPDLVALGRRVLRLDFRGHGRSGRTPGEYHMEGYVADAAAVCSQVAEAPCIVIGHSLGGGTAAGLAQRHPELVRALVLEDPPLGAARRLEGNSLLDGFRLMRTSVPRLQADGIAVEVLAAILGRAPSPVGTPFAELLHADALTAMAEGMLQLDASVLDPVLEGVSTPVFDPDLPIDVPTLLITADPSSPDAVARPADAEQLIATSPLAEVLVMRGASHLVHDELAHRDAFRSAVLDFLRRLS
jgi:pimeloyl-ACP methyl ester carboxylesterase